MVLIVMYVTQLGPNQPNRCSAALPVRARACQIRAPKTHVLGRFSRGPYPDHVTVYPYNIHIRSTNPIVRHATSLTWALKRMLANQHALEHAKT